MSKSLCTKNQDGFTLTELLLCLIISSAVTLLALTFSGSWHRNRVEVIANEVQAALQYSRNAAMAKGTAMLLVPLSGSEDWSGGMIVCVDNPHHQCTEKDEVLHQWKWNQPGIRLLWRGFISSNYLIFSAQARHAASSGSFYVITQGVEQRKITVNRIGHILS